MVTVTIHGEQRQVQQGTTYEEIAADYQREYGGMIALVSVDGRIRELFKRVSRDCRVEFFTLQGKLAELKRLTVHHKSDKFLLVAIHPLSLLRFFVKYPRFSPHK